MNKFNLGDKVWYIEELPIETKKQCPTCLDVGKILINEESFSCPKCYGKGYLTKYERQKLIFYSDIYEICINREGITYLIMELNGNYSRRKEQDIFATKEEAENKLKEDK